MSKLLKIVGAFALFAWTAGGVAAWVATKDQVQVTLAEGAAEPGAPDPVALLADQVSTLQSDLRSLANALSENMGLVVERIEGRSGEEVQALDALRAELVQLRAAALRGPTSGPEIAPIAVRAVEDFAHAAATPPARKKGGFLSFKLPSDDFTFNKLQRFTVLGSLSRVGFDAKSTLHDFSGLSQSVSGHFDVNLAQPELGIEGELTVQSTSLDTALAGRDEAMHELFEVDKYPTIGFVPTSFQADSVNPKAQKVTGSVSGKMTIHGIEKPVTMLVAGRIDESRRLVLEGETALVMSEFKVRPPSKLGMISVEDEIRVWIALRARASEISTPAEN